VRRLSPGYEVTSIPGGTLFEDRYPPDDVAYAAVMPDATLVCDRRLVAEIPSELPDHLLAEAAARRIHRMSVDGIMREVGVDDPHVDDQR
jgi:hypothetical protein